MPDNSNPNSASGQLLGYSLQVSEFLRQLLTSPSGTKVTLEVFEDVGTTAPSGETVAIQTKSTLDGNPISDRARDLWKTLSNWANAAVKKRIEPKYTRFRIHVFSPTSGGIAESFANAASLESARQAIQAARKTLQANGKHVAATIKPFVELFFGTDETILAEIVMNFELTFGSGDTAADLRDALLAKWAPEDAVNEVLDKSLGFVKRTLDSAIQQGEIPCIAVNDFNREIGAYIGKLRLQNLLNDFAGEPDPADVEKHRLKTYVRQLELVGADDDTVLRAINAYLRSSHNRAVWATKGMVWGESFEEFETGLLAFWNNTKQQQDLDHAADQDQKRGLRLLIECLKHRALLEGKMTPDDFTSGSFHTLADELEIGWHPTYKQNLGDQ